MSSDGGPAFPRDHAHDGHNGMSLRDYFAAHASEEDIRAQAHVIRQAEVARTKGLCDVLPDGWRQIARYMHADAMLKAREKGGGS